MKKTFPEKFLISQYETTIVKKVGDAFWVN